SDPANAAIGEEEALDGIEIGKVVIPDFDGHRHVERADPVARCGELAGPRAHREIARDQHRIGPLASHAIGEPAERGAILESEMQVADMEESGHAVATKSTALVPSPKRAGEGVSPSSPAYSKLIGGS